MKIIEKHDQVLLRGILQHLPPETKLQIQTEVFNNGKREKCEFWSECYETSIRRSAKFLVANPLTDLKDLEMLKRVLEQQFPQYLESEIILNLLDNLTPRFRIGDQLFFSRIKILYIEDVRCFQEEHIQFIPEQNKIYCLIPWNGEDPSFVIKVLDEFQEPEWFGKVELIPIAVSQNTAEIVNMIVAYSIPYLVHYQFINEGGTESFKIQNLLKLNEGILINGQGQIVSQGADLNFIKSKIQELLQQKQGQQLEQNNDQHHLNNPLIKLKRAEYKQIKTCLQSINEPKGMQLCKLKEFSSSYIVEYFRAEIKNYNYDQEIPKIIEISQIFLLNRQIFLAKIEEVFSTLGKINYLMLDDPNFQISKLKNTFDIHNFRIQIESLNQEQFEIGIQRIKSFLLQFDQKAILPSFIHLLQVVQRQFLEYFSRQDFVEPENYVYQQKNNQQNKKKSDFVLVYLQGMQVLAGQQDTQLVSLIQEYKKMYLKLEQVIQIRCYLNSPNCDEIQDQELIQIFLPHYKQQAIADRFKQFYQFTLIDSFNKVIYQSNNMHQMLWYITVQIKKQSKPVIIEQENVIKPRILLTQQQILQFKNTLMNGVVDNLKFTLDIIQNNGQGDQQKPLAKLKYIVMENEAKVMLDCLSKWFSILPKENWIIYPNIIKDKLIKIPYPGKECFVCKKGIKKIPQQYYCPFKDQHVCVDCAEFDDKEQIGYKRFKYEDTLIFINGPLSEDCVLEIDQFRIGQNVKIQDFKKFNQNHFMQCQGCSIGEEGPRYISLNSNMRGLSRNYGFRYEKLESQFYNDFCHRCFQILKNKNSKSKEIVAKANIILDSLFLRVLFYHQGYWTY